MDNFDLRWEWFPSEGEIISIGAFKKDFTDPIVSTASLRVQAHFTVGPNAKNGTIKGLELEGRMNLFEFYSVGSNLTIVESELSELDAFATGSNTSFQGQPSYIFNFDIGLNLEEYQLTSNLFFNFVGEYLHSVSAGSIPNIIHKETMSLDFNLQKLFLENWSVKFSAQNILDPEQVTFYEGYEDRVHSSYKKGRSFGLSLNWSY